MNQAEAMSLRPIHQHGESVDINTSQIAVPHRVLRRKDPQCNAPVIKEPHISLSRMNGPVERGHWV